MKANKRLLFFAIWMSLVLFISASALTTTAYAEPYIPDESNGDQFEEYNLWIGGVRVTSYNCNSIFNAVDPETGKPTASFNSETNVLELHNPVDTGNYFEHSYIYSNIPLNITGTLNLTVNYDSWLYGIYSTNNIRIFDDDVMTDIRINITVPGNFGGRAIDASMGSFTLDGGYLWLRHTKGGVGTWRGDLTINGGCLDVESISGYPVSANSGNLIISEDVEVEIPANYTIKQDNDYQFIIDDAGATARKTLIKVKSYPLWLGGRQVTNDNKDNILKETYNGEPTASYDPTTKTLVLNNPTIVGHYATAKIYSADDLTIRGKAGIRVPGVNDERIGIMMYSDESLGENEIHTLTIEGEDTEIFIKADREAIFANNSHVHMKAGTLNVASIDARGISITKHGSFLMDDGYVEIYSKEEGLETWSGGDGYSIVPGESNITVTGGTIDAYSKNRAAIWAIGRIIYPNNYEAYDENGNILSLKSTGQGFVDESDRWLQGIRMMIEPKRPQRYGLVVSGVQVTEENASNVLGDNKVSFTFSEEKGKGTLTLQDADIYVSDLSDGTAAGIYLGNGYGGVHIWELDIKLLGENHIRMPGYQLEADHVYGIISESGSLEIDGFLDWETDNASLDISLTGSHNYSYGIYCDYLSRNRVSHDLHVWDSIININASANLYSCGIHCNGVLGLQDGVNRREQTSINIDVKAEDVVGIFVVDDINNRGYLSINANINHKSALSTVGISKPAGNCVVVDDGKVSINCGDSLYSSVGISGGYLRMYRGAMEIHAGEAQTSSYALASMRTDSAANMSVGDWYDFFGLGGTIELSGHTAAVDDSVSFDQHALSEGVLVGETPSYKGAEAWDGNLSLQNYKYIHIPGRTNKITLHWSSMEGVDIEGQPPIVLEVPQGMTIKAALANEGLVFEDALFQKTGYQDSGYRLYEPLTDYNKWSKVRETEQVDPNTMIYADTDIYFIMGKTINEVVFDVKVPVCGTSIDGKPVVTMKSTNASPFYTGWIAKEEVFKGGNEYKAIFEIRANFGYLFSESVKGKINGKTVNNDGYTYYGDYTFKTNIKAQHKLSKTAAKAATCGKAGNKEYWTCSGCKKVFSDAEGTKATTVSAMTIKATGKHKWDKGTVAKEATLTAAGEMTYKCTVCKTTKKEPIPKLTIDTMDIGNVWTTLSPVQGIAFTTAFDKDGKLNKQMEFADQWWQDVTNGASGGKQIHINENNLPELGHTYQFYVKIKPKKGYSFDKSDKFKKFVYGGKEVASKNYTKTMNKDGSITLTWGLKAKTTPENINDKTLGLTVTGIVDKSYTGRAITQSPTIKAKVRGKTVTLKNGTDYTVSYKNNTAPGTATVIITGKGKYTGTKNVTFKITHTHTWDSGKVTTQPTIAKAGVKTFTCTVCKATRTEPIAKLKEVALKRVYGDDRYTTALAIAETYMNETGQKKLNSIIVACATNFPDALAGSYLANAKKAPIIIWHDSRNGMIQNFIKQKVNSGGTVYILGGTSAVGDSIKKNMGGYKFVRLADSNRYGTNIRIINAVGIKNAELLVCDATEAGKGINALIASATGKPILLVAKGGLLDVQKTWLSQNKSKITKITIIGNANSVDAKVESQLKAYGKVSRIGGKNADEVSANVGKTYFKDAKEVFIATMDNYPDGLCGGPLAIVAKGPIILVNNSVNAASANYTKTLNNLQRATVFGGDKAMPEATARKVAKNTKAKMTEFKKQ